MRATCLNLLILNIQQFLGIKSSGKIEDQNAFEDAVKACKEEYLLKNNLNKPEPEADGSETDADPLGEAKSEKVLATE